MNNIEQIGIIPQKVIDILQLDIPSETVVYISETNRNHMMSSHPKDYEKYSTHISEIIANPTYVGINESDYSIEFIKKFKHNVKIAVRIANDGEYYARTMYEVGKSRIENSLLKGQLKKC